jgi:hypothetical protein
MEIAPSLVAIQQLRTNKKILSADKPDSVVPENRDGHHLSCLNITAEILLPTLQRSRQVAASIERAALRRWCTWHYSTQGLPVALVTPNNRELLPPVFTLICIEIEAGPISSADGNFLWHCLFRHFAGPGN